MLNDRRTARALSRIAILNFKLYYKDTVIKNSMVLAYTHTHTHTHIYTHIHSCTHEHTYIQACTHINTQEQPPNFLKRCQKYTVDGEKTASLAIMMKNLDIYM